MYNYYEAMMNDVRSYINNEIELNDFETIEELEESLNDNLWIDDSVTGNGSGSYTFNSYTAKEYVTENEDLCREALEEFCVDADTIAEKFLEADWEYFDVTIRCYLLGQIVGAVLEEIADEFEEMHEAA